MGIPAGVKAAPIRTTIQSGTGHDGMCLEDLTFCEAVLPDALTSSGFLSRLRRTAVLSVVIDPLCEAVVLVKLTSRPHKGPAGHGGAQTLGPAMFVRVSRRLT